MAANPARRAAEEKGPAVDVLVDDVDPSSVKTRGLLGPAVILTGSTNDRTVCVDEDDLGTRGAAEDTDRD